MLTRPPSASAPSPPPDERRDDLSGHRHRQVIGYLGFVLPILLVVFGRIRPNAPQDQWLAASISAYYWTGAVSLFAGLLAALSLFLLTYRGYANEEHKYDRGAAIIAGIAAAVVAIFPTSPPAGIAPPWWAKWIAIAHAVAAIALFSMFAVFSLWLFRKTGSEERMDRDKQVRNAIHLVCGIGILASMIWAGVAGQMNASMFWPESVALWFFAWSWLTKGRALRSLKSTVVDATTPPG